MEITFQIETAFFSGAIRLRKHVRTDVLENVLLAGQVVSELLKIILILVYEISNDSRYFWLQCIFTIQLQKVLFFVSVLVESGRHALFPKHVDHLMLVFFRQFSI